MMSLFEPPPSTRYDLRFTLANIPIRVHPLFWVMTILFGISSLDILQLVIWIAVVFVSILVHELGHALVMRFYGQSAQVVLHFAGGLAVPQPEPVRWGNSWVQVSLRPREEILVVLAGPGAGFLLAALVMIGILAVGGSVMIAPLFYVLPLPIAILPTDNPIVNLLVRDLLWVNVFWGLMNLLPVYPLDGGQVARHVFIMADSRDGKRKSLWVSVIVGAVVAIASLVLLRSTYMTVLFGLLAFQSYQALQGRGG